MMVYLMLQIERNQNKSLLRKLKESLQLIMDELQSADLL